MRRPVSFKSDGLRLVGILGEPDGDARRRGVVLVHGWSGYRIGPHQILVRAARRLNEEGFATIHFDLRGRGDSEGEYGETDIDMMIADTLQAAAILRDEAACDDVSFLGICSGANVAIGAATLDHSVREVVAWSAFPFQKQATKSQAVVRRRANALTYVGKAFRVETWRKILSGRVNYRLVRKALGASQSPGADGRNLKDSSRDILAELAHYPGRVLFVHGTKDPEGMLGREHFQPFCSEHGVRAEFALIRGANHSYYSLAWEEDLLNQAIAFLTDTEPQPSP